MTGGGEATLVLGQNDISRFIQSINMLNYSLFIGLCDLHAY